MGFSFTHPYTINPDFKKRVAYLYMEFGIHQPLKTYAGGLGFLAGSHMRSAYELQQNIVGIGILWKYGYYDQVRKQDQAMDTSGMSAAMNGAVNVSITDGWFPKFAKDKINSFIIPPPPQFTCSSTR